MWQAVWATVKAAGLALAWWKQKTDQDTGRELQRGDDSAELVKQAQEIHDAQHDPAVTGRVREQSYRDGPQ